MRRDVNTMNELNAADFAPPEDPGRSISPDLMDLPDPSETASADDESELSVDYEGASAPQPTTPILPEALRVRTCTTPGCSRAANVGYNTCCRYCGETYSHSNECNARNHLRPLQRQERVRVVQTRHNVYPDTVWTYPTGEKYHFNPSCRFFSQARSSQRGRSFTACNICSAGPSTVLSETIREETVER